ncbi:MAG: helix-turn-helix transcriptional regulator [Verrucomicrobia bacterium]|nr:helix-turn-helix transcriptional regulator [Verrucomicrobiota bacterium]
MKILCRNPCLRLADQCFIKLISSVEVKQQTRSGNQDERFTPCESEILAFVSKGDHSKKIAEALKIGAHIVETQLRNIYEKLHARSRAQAVARFLNGWERMKRRQEFHPADTSIPLRVTAPSRSCISKGRRHDCCNPIRCRTSSRA